MGSIKIKVLPGAEIPQYATEGSAGFDLVAHSFKKLFKGDREVDITKELRNSIDNGYLMLRPYERLLVGTGLSVELPVGTELQIRPRSGNSLKKGLMISNSPGTIDSDYRGEIGVILYNSTQFLLRVEIGEKIAQGVVTDYIVAKFEQTDELSNTQRGLGGFGSTSESKAGPVRFG